MTELHNMRLRDGVNNTLIQEVNTAKEAKVKDTDTLAKLVEILAKNTEILAKNTEILAKNTDIETNQTDKTQYARLTDATTDVDVTLQNELKVFSYEYMIEVQRGNVPGASIVHKFGRNAAVPNGTFEGVNQLSALFNFLTAATTVRVKAGGNAADTAGGAGAQSITLEGLDDTGAFATETIATNGASASASTTTSFWRVFRAYIPDGAAGTYGGANTAIVTIENTAGTIDLIMLAAGEGQSQYGAYAIPVAKTGYLMGVKVQADGQKAADFRLCVRNDLTDFSTPFSPRRIKFYWDGVLGSDNLMGSSPLLKIDALSDIWMEAEGSGANTEVSVDFEILLIDD